MDNLDHAVENNNWKYPHNKVIICGAREVGNESCREAIDEFLSHLKKNCVIVHGGCKGVDIIVDMYSRKRGLPVIVYPAEWDKHGKAAGYIRNKRMLLEEKPDLVIAFHPALDKSKGTKHMIETANKANYRTMCIKI